jgi:xanthine dehydrogenase accessory factor
MGSLKSTVKRKERLKSLGLTNKQLLRLKAPIGIDIHSKTPQEIAIAIIAELISARYVHKHKPQKP